MTARSDDTRPRPMVAILEAKRGQRDSLRRLIVDLVREVRREPGCVAFVPYEARDIEGRFYLFEAYTDAAAFETHLRMPHVRQFIDALPSVVRTPAELVQLDEIEVPLKGR